MAYALPAAATDFRFAPEFEFRTRWQFAPHVLSAALALPGYVIFWPLHRGQDYRQLLNFSRRFDIEEATRLAEHLARVRPDCTHVTEAATINQSAHPSRVTDADGNSFIISADYFCVEITSPPQTLAAIRADQDRLQRDVFDAARRFGLRPAGGPDALSGLHVNVDASPGAIRGPTLFRFLMALANFPELGDGLLGRALSTGRPAAMNARGRQRLREFVAWARQRRARREALTVEDVAREYYRLVQYSLRGKGDAVNVSSITDPRVPVEQRRVELRFPRMVKTSAHWTRLLEIFDAWLRHLDTSDVIDAFDDRPLETRPAARLRRFEELLSSLGLDAADYRDLLPARYTRWRDCARWFR